MGHFHGLMLVMPSAQRIVQQVFTPVAGLAGMDFAVGLGDDAADELFLVLQRLAFAPLLFGQRIVGADIVAPNPARNIYGITTTTAAKLVREITVLAARNAR